MHHLLATLCAALFTFAVGFAPAAAVVIDLGDGSGNATAPADDPGWDYMGIQGGLGVIYLGNNWVLTAAHVSFQNVIFGGVAYTSVPGTHTLIPHLGVPGPYADLAVWQIEDGPDMPLLPIRETPPNVNDEVVMIGYGRTRSTSQITCGGVWAGFDTSSPNTMRWGTNEVAGTNVEIVLGGFTSRTFYNQFDADPPGASDPRCAAGIDCPEAIATEGDSGGGVFLHDGTRWELAGVMIAVASQPCNDPSHPETVLFGNQTFMADLSNYRSKILAIVRPECSDEVDNDGDLLVDLADPGCLDEMDDDETPDCDGTDDDFDGIGNVCDNCLAVANPYQIDTDGDLFGNFCDGDYDNNDEVDGGDFSTFRGSFLQTFEDPNYNPDVDFDSDGSVGGSDFNFFRSVIGGKPGPSGLVP